MKFVDISGFFGLKPDKMNTYQISLHLYHVALNKRYRALQNLNKKERKKVHWDDDELSTDALEELLLINCKCRWSIVIL